MFAPLPKRRPDHRDASGRRRPPAALINSVAANKEVQPWLSPFPKRSEPVLASIYPLRPRLLYLLRKQASASPEAFETALAQWRRDQPYGVAAGGQLARAGVAIAERQQDIDGRFRPAGAEVTPVDGYISIDLEIYAPAATDFERLLGLANEVLHSLDVVVDRKQSIALAGIASLPIPGFAPFSMILHLDRPRSMSWLEYNTWWVHHGDDHRAAFPTQAGYHQLHTDPAFNTRAAQAAGAITSDLCITDIMYLGDLKDAFANMMDKASEDARRVQAEIGANVGLHESA